MGEAGRHFSELIIPAAATMYSPAPYKPAAKLELGNPPKFAYRIHVYALSALSRTCISDVRFASLVQSSENSFSAQNTGVRHEIYVCI